MDDHYETLQVAPLAEPEIIEAAYRRLARKYHPDVYKGADANDRMQKLNAAHEVLSDPERRAEYDRARGDQPQSSAASSSSSDTDSPHTATAANVEDVPSEGDSRAPVRSSSPVPVLAAAGVLLVLLLAALAIGSRVFPQGALSLILQAPR